MFEIPMGIEVINLYIMKLNKLTFVEIVGI